MSNATQAFAFELEPVACEHFTQLLSGWTPALWISIICLVAPIWLSKLRRFFWSNPIVTAALETLVVSLLEIVWIFVAYIPQDATRVECADDTVKAAIYVFLRTAVGIEAALEDVLTSWGEIITAFIILILLFILILRYITPWIRNLVQAMALVRRQSASHLEKDDTPQVNTPQVNTPEVNTSQFNTQSSRDHVQELQFHLDYSYEVIEALVESYTELKNTSRTQIRDASGQKERFENEARALRRELRSARDEVNNLEDGSELQEAWNRVDFLETRLATLQDKLAVEKTQHTAAVKRIAELEATITTLTAQLDSLNANKKHPDLKIVSMGEKIALLTSDLEKAQEQLRTLQDEVRETKEAHEASIEEKNSEALESSQIKSELESLRTALTAVTTAKDAALREVEALKTASTNKESELVNSNAELEKKSQSLEDSEKRLAEVEKMMQEASSSHQSLQTDFDAQKLQLNDANSAIQILNQELSDANQDKATSSPEITRQANRIAELEEVNSRIRIDLKAAEDKASADREEATRNFANFEARARDEFQRANVDAQNNSNNLESQLEQMTKRALDAEEQISIARGQVEGADKTYRDQVERTNRAEALVDEQKRTIDALRAQLQARPAAAVPAPLPQSNLFSFPTATFNFGTNSSSSAFAPTSAAPTTTPSAGFTGLTFNAPTAAPATNSINTSINTFLSDDDAMDTTSMDAPVIPSSSTNVAPPPNGPLATTSTDSGPTSGPAYSQPTSQAFVPAISTPNVSFTAPPQHHAPSMLTPVTSTNLETEAESDEDEEEAGSDKPCAVAKFCGVVGTTKSWITIDRLMIDRHGSENPLAESAQGTGDAATEIAVAKSYTEDVRGFLKMLQGAYNESHPEARSAWDSLCVYRFDSDDFEPEPYMGIVFWLRSLNYKLGHLLDASESLAGNVEASRYLQEVLSERFDLEGPGSTTQKTARECLLSEWKPTDEAEPVPSLVGNLVARLRRCEKLFIECDLTEDEAAWSFSDVDVKHPALAEHEHDWDQYMQKTVKKAAAAKRAAMALVGPSSRGGLRAWTVDPSRENSLGNALAAREKTEWQSIANQHVPAGPRKILKPKGRKAAQG
ncbi:hypothetical protein K490DRAFT_52812 [Saccharata proteae CBS 121410]|uniref:Uncharacterized protein n=1 Tax=Saccharata proteae CBS 121410 TaxID=1314787 RepID=A0A9P4I4F1_9PEZI|nr:hypothetical protein K490DRAFT_52812 [Saccharata proteae CBS 121410]